MKNIIPKTKIIITACIVLIISIVYSLNLLNTTPTAKAFDLFCKYNCFRRINDSNYIKMNKIYAVLDDGKVLFKDEIFDPKTEKFIPLPKILGGFKFIKLKNGKILSLGRYDSSVIDPKAFKQISKAKFNESRENYDAIMLKDGKVLVVGGEFGNYGKGHRYLRSVEIYDPDTNKFTLIDNMLVPMASPRLSLLENGNVLIVGGYNNKGNDYQAELYNPNTGKLWVIGKPINHIAGDINIYKLPNRKILIIGNQNNAGVWYSPRNQPVLYNPKTCKFELTGKLSGGRHNFSTAMLPDGRVLVMGGVTGGTSIVIKLKSTEAYNTMTNTFTSFKDMKIGGAGTAISLKDGSILIVGEGPDFKSAEIFSYRKQ